MSTTATTKKIASQIPTGADIIRSVKIFFGLKVRVRYNKSRIVRKPAKAYEEFIFKGYDQQRPGLSKPGSFKKIRIISKN